MIGAIGLTPLMLSSLKIFAITPIFIIMAFCSRLLCKDIIMVDIHIFEIRIYIMSKTKEKILNQVFYC